MSDPEDDEADQVDMLVSCTLGWTGAAVPFSPQAARALYTDPKRRWLRDQVQAALIAAWQPAINRSSAFDGEMGLFATTLDSDWFTVS